MAIDSALVEGFQNASANSVEVAYSAAVDTLITAFTVTNNTGVNRSYRAYIYDSAGNATPAVVPLKFVTANKGFNIAAPILGHIVRKGGSIRVESSAESSLSFWVSGQILE